MARAFLPIKRMKGGKEGRWHRVRVPWLRGVFLRIVNVYVWVWDLR